jgi:hypothetical protein
MAKSLAAVACAVGADIRLGPVRDSRLGHGAVHNTDAASARPLPCCVAPSISFRNRFANIESARPHLPFYLFLDFFSSSWRLLVVFPLARVMAFTPGAWRPCLARPARASAHACGTPDAGQLRAPRRREKTAPRLRRILRGGRRYVPLAAARVHRPLSRSLPASTLAPSRRTRPRSATQRLV